MTDDTHPRLLPAIVDATPATPATTTAPLSELDYLIALWLHEQRSPRTRTEYAATLADFRAAFQQSAGYDLDCGDHALIARLAQVWSKRPTRQRGREGREPSSAMQARRYAILSSFYQFGIRMDMQEWTRDRKTGEVYRAEIVANPLRKVKRPSVQRYAEAQPIELRELLARLRRIDRASVEGKRDYALLSVALMTGRRIAELAGMRRGSLTFGRDHRVTVRFPTKGGKVLRDHLGQKTSAALLNYLRATHQIDDPSMLPSDAPVWVAYSRNTAAWTEARHAGQAQPMTTSGLRRIFLRRIGTSKAHATRHTLTANMDALGAPLSEIQARLGHASAATTALYLNALKSADNPYTDQLEALLGLE